MPTTTIAGRSTDTALAARLRFRMRDAQRRVSTTRERDQTYLRALTTRTADFARHYRRFALPVPGFHETWYDALDGPAPNVLLLGPREHGKTECVVTYALHQIVENRSIRIGVLSQTGPLARMFMNELRQLLDDPLLVDAYGSFKSSIWSGEQMRVLGSAQTRDMTCFALGSGSQVTGRHCDILIFDDVESTASVKTLGRRATTKHWFTRDATPVLSAGGKMIVIGTRKHYDDLYASLLHDEEDWTLLDQSPRAILEDGSPLWPERWSLHELLSRKRRMDKIDIRAWAQEYENRPIAGDQIMFDPDTWPTYDRLDPAWKRYQGWDLAISDKAMADYTACVTVAVDEWKNIYIVDVARGHWTIEELAPQLDIQDALYSPETGGIEAAGFQAPLVKYLLQNSHTKLRPVKPPGDKVTHARYLEAKVANRQIFAPRDRPAWWADFAEELTNFPAGAHDDQVDATAYALDVALPISAWQQFFEDEIAESAARVDAAASPQLRLCTACQQEIGTYAHESTLFPNKLFCSEQCLQRYPILVANGGA